MGERKTGQLTALAAWEAGDRQSAVEEQAEAGWSRARIWERLAKIFFGPDAALGREAARKWHRKTDLLTAMMATVIFTYFIVKLLGGILH